MITRHLLGQAGLKADQSNIDITTCVVPSCEASALEQVAGGNEGVEPLAHEIRSHDLLVAEFEQHAPELRITGPGWQARYVGSAVERKADPTCRHVVGGSAVAVGGRGASAGTQIGRAKERRYL